MRDTLILFDFDGTIMDTEVAILRSYEELFRRYRTVEEFTREKQISVLGPTIEEMMRTFFPEQDPSRLQQEYRSYQNEHMEELVKPMEGAVELLYWLKEEGYVCGIVSSRRSTSLNYILDFTGLGPFFSLQVCHNHVEHEKPHPEGILKARELYPSKDCIYIGDSPTDIEAGKNAGVKTIACLFTKEKEEPLREEHADYYVEKLLDIKDILREIER